MSNRQGGHDDVHALKGEPSGYFVLVRQDSVDESSLDLTKLIADVVVKWRVLLFAVFIGMSIAAILAIRMPDTYLAQVIAVPITQNNGGSGGGLRSQFGGLAALAGIDLGGNSRVEESIATLNSRGFVRDFILAENLLPVLFESKWDEQKKTWLPGKKQPTVEDAVDFFIKKVRNIAEDRKSGVVTVGIEWRSPELAASWANKMIEQVNNRLRLGAIHSANKNIDYLNKELEKSQMVELRQAIFRLTETQINNAMLANVQHEYAFRVIDPAFPPEDKEGPKRVEIVLIGAFLGLFLGVVILFGYFAARSGVDSMKRRP